MSASQVVVLVSLLARIYSVPEAQMQCMVYRESSYNVEAINGVHIGLAQFRPETLTWMAGMASDDPLFLHSHMTPSAGDPVYSLALMAWAMRNGYGEHWSTWELCN